MFRLLFVLLAGLTFFAAPVAAKKDKIEQVVVADTAENFEVLVVKIRDEMAPGKRYEFLGKKDRTLVNTSLDKMSAMLAQDGDVESMAPEERAKMITEQEKVNALLARNSDDRLVCSHVAPAGSHLPVTVCHTAREIAERNRHFRTQANELDSQQRAINAANMAPGG